jgi:hypothetical protein
MTTPMDYETLLATLRTKFEGQLEARLGEIRRLARAVEADLSAVRELRFAVHNLAGIAGSFGHPLLSGAAAHLDGLLAGKAPDQLDRATLVALADQLRPDWAGAAGRP